MIETVLMTMLVSIAIFMFWFGYDQATNYFNDRGVSGCRNKNDPGIVILIIL